MYRARRGGGGEGRGAGVGGQGPAEAGLPAAGPVGAVGAAAATGQIDVVLSQGGGRHVRRHGGSKIRYLHSCSGPYVRAGGVVMSGGGYAQGRGRGLRGEARIGERVREAGALRRLGGSGTRKGAPSRRPCAGGAAIYDVRRDTSGWVRWSETGSIGAVSLSSVSPLSVSLSSVSPSLVSLASLLSVLIRIRSARPRSRVPAAARACSRCLPQADGGDPAAP